MAELEVLAVAPGELVAVRAPERELPERAPVALAWEPELELVVPAWEPERARVALGWAREPEQRERGLVTPEPAALPPERALPLEAWAVQEIPAWAALAPALVAMILELAAITPALRPTPESDPLLAQGRALA